MDSTNVYAAEMASTTLMVNVFVNSVNDHAYNTTYSNAHKELYQSHTLQRTNRKSHFTNSVHILLNSPLIKKNVDPLYSCLGRGRVSL